MNNKILNYGILILVGLILTGSYVYWATGQANESYSSSDYVELSDEVKEEILQDLIAEGRNIFQEGHARAIADVGDPKFTEFVATVIEPLCPFYYPDGASYRSCLYDLAAEKRAKFSGDAEAVKAIEDYCFNNISEDRDSLSFREVYSKCLIYKFSQ